MSSKRKVADDKELAEKIKKALKSMTIPPILGEPATLDMESSIPDPQATVVDDADLVVNETELHNIGTAKQLVRKLRERLGVRLVLRLLSDTYEDDLKTVTCDNHRTLFTHTRDALKRLAQEIL